MEAATILIVEDDRSHAELVQDILESVGYQTLRAVDGVEGLWMVQKYHPDLILLDVMMPRMDGWETCRRVREFSDVPIIMLTCRGEESDIVRGLDLGADDYLPKPYGQRELLARVKAALRRANNRADQERLIRIDDRLTIDRERRAVFVEGQLVPLSATEFRLLLSLVDNKGRISTYASLLTQVWGWEYADERDYLKTYIYHLRRKIEPDPRHPVYILTERGQGYRFQVPSGFLPNFTDS